MLEIRNLIDFLSVKYNIAKVNGMLCTIFCVQKRN